MTVDHIHNSTCTCIEPTIACMTLLIIAERGSKANWQTAAVGMLSAFASDSFVCRLNTASETLEHHHLGDEAFLTSANLATAH